MGIGLRRRPDRIASSWTLSRRSGADRDKERMRRGEWRWPVPSSYGGRGLLPDPRLEGGRREILTVEGLRAERSTPSFAAGVPGGRGGPVRLLHTGVLLSQRPARRKSQQPSRSKEAISAISVAATGYTKINSSRSRVASEKMRKERG